MEEVLDLVGIEKYPDLNNSGAAWMGQIPGHWQSLRMKFLFRDVSTKGKPDSVLLSVTQDQGVVPRDWVENRMVMPSGALESFKFIHKGDFAISLRSFEGGLEYCHHDGIISPAYTVLQATGKIDNDYFKFLFKSSSFISELQTSVVGIRQGKNISYQQLSYSLVPVPPIREQTAIARFLDRKTALIDKAIAIKEKQIELLKERRQILIHNAVTRGLNPDVKMKDSGVKWIGDIPAHWDFEPIKYSLHGIIDTEHKTVPFVDEQEFLVVRTSNVKDGKLVLDDAKYTSAKGFAEWTKRGIPNPSDIILTREAPAGEACIIPAGVPLCLGQRTVWLKVNRERILPEMIIYLIYSKLGRTYIDFLSSGSTVVHFNMADIKNIPVLRIPLDEQLNIIEFVNNLSSRIDGAVSIMANEIRKWMEYRASLINSAVTGKIKVC